MRVSQERACCGRDAPHPSRLRRATFPPVGGRLSAYSNRVELLPLWDVWIHILGIGAECACWGWGQSCRGPLIRLAFARHLPLKGKASGRPGVPPLRSEGDLYDGRVWDPPLRCIYEWLCI